MPDGVLFNGLGPYRYNETNVPDGIAYEIINVEPGKWVMIEILHFHFKACCIFSQIFEVCNYLFGHVNATTFAISQEIFGMANMLISFYRQYTHAFLLELFSASYLSKDSAS